MASSGNMGTSNKYIVYWVEQIQNSQDIGQNFSNVTIRVWIKRTNTGYTTYGSGTCYVNIDGGAYTSSLNTGHKITSTPICIFETNVNIWHNGDGTKSFGVGVRINHSVFSSNEQWANFGLSTIPRTSNATLSSNNFHINGGVTIHTNRASSSFTHTIWEDFGLGWWREIASGVGDNWHWTPGYDLANRIPNSTSGHGRIRVATYSGGTYIGEVVRDFTTYINDGECVPWWNGTPYFEIIQENNIPAGKLVKTQNRVRIRCNPSGSYGSTITSISVNFWNQRTEGSSDAVSPYPDRWGNQNIWITARDSRGREIYHTLNIWITDWFSPWVSIDKVWRCNENGVEDPNGTQIKCRVRADAPTLDNTWSKHSLKVWMRRVGDTGAWTSVADDFNASSYDIYPYMNNTTTENSYEIWADLDVGGTIHTAKSSIGTGFVTLDFRHGGKGIAIGKVAENDGYFDIALTPVISPNSTKDGLMDFKWVGCGTNKYEMSLFGHNTDKHDGSYIWGLYNNSKGNYILSYCEGGFRNDHWFNIHTQLNCHNHINSFMGHFYWLSNNESQIRPDYYFSNKADIYAFWNQNECGYYWAGHDYAWRLTKEGQLTLRGGFNTTSDSREKHDISYMGAQHARFMSFGDESTQVEEVDMLKLHSKLKPSVFKMNNDPSEKYHFGFIAQDIEQAIIEENFTDCGVVSEDIYRKVEEIKDDDGNIIKDGSEAIRMAVSYQDLIALNTFAIQEYKKEIELNRVLIDNQRDIIESQEIKIKNLEDTLGKVLERLDLLEKK